jgi:dUTP pyrophosphatase
MNGDKVAQAVFVKAEDVVFTQVDSVDKTDRGEGGFGSTDKKEEENKKEE